MKLAFLVLLFHYWDLFYMIDIQNILDLLLSITLIKLPLPDDSDGSSFFRFL